MFVAVIVIFGICWLPYHVYFIYSYHDPTITRYILLPRPYYYKVYTPSMFTIYTTTTKLPLKGIYSCHYHTITRCTPTLFTLYTTTKTLLIQGIYDATMFILYTMYILIYDDLTITRFILLPRPYHYKGYTPTMILILQGKTIIPGTYMSREPYIRNKNVQETVYQEYLCPGNSIS